MRAGCPLLSPHEAHRSYPEMHSHAWPREALPRHHVARTHSHPTLRHHTPILRDGSRYTASSAPSEVDDESARGSRSLGPSRITNPGISAVLHERLQKVSVLEVRQSAPEVVLERELPRKHLLDEAARRLEPVHAGAQPLAARDLRKVDPTFAIRHEPAFIIRNGAILASFAPCDLHAIILRDRFYLLLPPQRKQSSMAATTARETLRIFARLVEENDPAKVSEKLRSCAHEELAAAKARASRLQPSARASTQALTPRQSGQLEPPLLAAPPGQGGGTAPPVAPRGGGGAADGASESSGEALHELHSSCDGFAEAEAHAGGVEWDGTLLPFEYLAMEAILVCTCSRLHTETVQLEQRVDDVVEGIRQSIEDSSPTPKHHEQLREVKHLLEEQLERSQAIERAIARVLEVDSDLCAMHLSMPRQAPPQKVGSRRASLLPHDGAPNGGSGGEKSSEQSRARAAHETLEILLECYLQELAQTIDALELSMEDVTATEKLASFRLDAARNRLLKVEVAATAVGTAMGIGAVTTGMFGMNLKTPLFDSDEFEDGWTFNLVVPSIAFVCFMVSFSMICFLYCPSRRLRSAASNVCCSWCRPRQTSVLPKLPSHDATLRRLLTPACDATLATLEEGDSPPYSGLSDVNTMYNPNWTQPSRASIQ
ncbi:hypothetical protein AB1Y20_010606 [Prymnesium parvum]|uniref:Magnesium transporter n=1 Tax=Prymnesium parvum TaxID=97485 RepID=A0AB34IRY5_PRYPA